MDGLTGDEREVPLPPPPRRVRRTPGSADGCRRAFVAPFVLVALALLVAIPIRLGVQWAGHPVTATIDALERHGGRNASYVARFHYTLDGRAWVDGQQVTADEFNRLHVGDAVDGRAAVFLGHPLVLTAAGSVGHMTGLLAAVAVAFAVMVALLVYGSWVVPARTRRLLETGTAVAGEVMAAMPFHGRRGYGVRVAYRFATPDGDEGGNLTVPGPPTDATAVGRSVTVVYDPGRPSRSTVYELSGYTVQP